MRFFLRLFPLGPLGAALLALAGCSGGKAPEYGRAATKEAVPVALGTVVQKTLPIELRAIGNVQAYSTVSVKSLVSGQILKVHFVEGQNVQEGDLLFTIDPRPLEAALKQTQANLRQAEAHLRQAEANLARDTAEAKNAEAEANRYAQLYRSGVAAAEQYDQYRTKAEASKAAIEADAAALQAGRAAMQSGEAAIENAKLNLSYTNIRSPMDGRTGNLIVHAGNLVKANENPALVVINQVHPIYASFAVPAQHLPEIRRRMASSKLKVQASPKEGGSASTGELTFIDNAIDVTTATIQLKGAFANRDNALWPGEFVNVVLTLGTQPNAVVVPSAAIQTGQQGQYVFVARPDLTVESRPVKVSRASERETVIEKGLQPGEKVVTDGQLRLVPDAKVRVVER